MALTWGHRSRRSLPWWVAVLLLAAVSVAGAQQVHHVLVDPVEKRLVIAPTVPGDYRICDGLDGACVPVSSLRAATAGLRQRAPR